MALTSYRVVLDTNVLLRGIIRAASSSGRVLAACDRRYVVPVLSKPVMVEYRAILTDPILVTRYPELTPVKVQSVLARLWYVSDLFRTVREKFHFPRDPKDAKLIELAIAAEATHLITSDRDLLDLPTGSDDTSRRFRQRLPALKVLDSKDFLFLINQN